MVLLQNVRMHDGSRQFGELPLGADWYGVRDRVLRLPGAALTGFLCGGVTEAWIDFAYEGHSFTINDQFGAYWFFVSDPACPEDLLRVVLDHFDRLSNQNQPRAADSFRSPS